MRDNEAQFPIVRKMYDPGVLLRKAFKADDNSTVYYDEDALTVANLAAGFMRYGVEARHLRMYKTAGEREAGFFEQVVMPMLKQRNPQARSQATETLSELSRLGASLRAAMLRQALRQYLEGP